MPEKKCKNCKYWVNGECMGINTCDPGFRFEQDPKIRFEVEVEAYDDSCGLEYALKTGPEFGCVRFKKKI